MEVRIVKNIKETRHDKANVTVREKYEDNLEIKSCWKEYKVEKIKDTPTK